MKFHKLTCVKCRRTFTSAVSDKNAKKALHCNTCRYHRGWNPGKYRKITAEMSPGGEARKS